MSHSGVMSGFFLRGVALDALHKAILAADKLVTEGAEAKAPAPVWVQVAAEGEYKGHTAGAFTLDSKVFGQLVTNFRAHPSYAKGADGNGASDVIAWDFHHKSETNEDAIAVQGAPAQGWVQELQQRQGANGIELWALTRWLDLARDYIKKQAYKWASVAIWPNATDNKSGQDVGWYMSSVALTNDPFIQGMAPLTAEAKRLLKRGGTDWVISELRWLFGLPKTAGLEQFAEEVAKVASYATGEVTAPAGVDVVSLVQGLRGVLNLPTLSTDEEVLAEAGKLITSLTTAAAEPPTTMIGATKAQETTMPEKLKLLLAKRLGVPCTDEQVETAILASLDDGAKAKGDVDALYSAMGVDDHTGALKRVVELVGKEKRLDDAEPQIAKLRADQSEAAAKEDVDAVDAVIAANRSMGAEVRPALLSMRTGGIKLEAKMTDEQWAVALERRAASQAEFAKTYPVAAPSAAYLTRPLVTQGGQGNPMRGLAATHAAGQGAPTLPAAPPGQGQAGLMAEIKACAGRNITEQAIAYVESQPGGDALSFEKKHEKASRLLQSLRSV